MLNNTSQHCGCVTGWRALKGTLQRIRRRRAGRKWSRSDKRGNKRKEWNEWQVEQVVQSRNSVTRQRRFVAPGERVEGNSLETGTRDVRVRGAMTLVKVDRIWTSRAEFTWQEEGRSPSGCLLQGWFRERKCQRRGEQSLDPQNR